MVCNTDVSLARPQNPPAAGLSQRDNAYVYKQRGKMDRVIRALIL
jgi:hypothetical protein